MNDARAKKNVAVLAVCQALFMSANVIMIMMGGLIGHILAVDKALATLPVTAVIGGVALATFPASMLMGRVGRRAGFMVGGLCGLAGVLMASLGVYIGSFWLFVLGALGFGFFSAFAHYYRFAAADIASDKFRGKAISLVLAGGIVAGFAGPEIAKLTKDLFSNYLYLGTCLATAGLCLLSLAMQAFIDLPLPVPAAPGRGGRRLGLIVRHPVFIVAALSGMIGFGVMNLLMTSTPLAMTNYFHFHFDDAASVIQWHVVGMFAPSFVTGSLIARFGAPRIVFAGTSINIVCVGIALAGVDFLDFWLALTLLGVGWNLMFVGASTLLTEIHDTAERARTQGANDLLIFGAMALTSYASGFLLHRMGWTWVLLSALPFLLLAMAAILQLMRVRHRPVPV